MTREELINNGHELCVEFADKVKRLMLDELAIRVGKVKTNKEVQEVSEDFASEYTQVLQHLDIIEMCIRGIAE